MGNIVQISEKFLHKSDSKLHTYLVQGIQNISEIEIKITLFERRAKQSQKVILDGVDWEYSHWLYRSFYARKMQAKY